MRCLSRTFLVGTGLTVALCAGVVGAQNPQREQLARKLQRDKGGSVISVREAFLEYAKDLRHGNR